jgi:hypothetical protein
MLPKEDRDRKGKPGEEDQGEERGGEMRERDKQREGGRGQRGVETHPSVAYAKVS